jgi:hypothetical protein
MLLVQSRVVDDKEYKLLGYFWACGREEDKLLKYVQE